MTLLPNETIVATDVKGLTLTNLRIRHTDGTFLSSMYLEELSSIHYTKEHKPIFIILGVFFGIVAGVIATRNVGPELLGAAALAILCIVWYFMTRQTDFELVSRGGGKIELSVNNKSAITELVDLIEKSKLSAADLYIADDLFSTNLDD